MSIGFILVNGAIGTLGSYLVFRRYQHLGLLAAGVTLVVGSLVSMPGERWWPMAAAVGAALLLHRLIGDPIEA
jgi:hypothetical protein